MDENKTSDGLNPPPLTPASEPVRVPPPVIAPRPPAQARPRRATAWIVISVILFCLLCLSLLMNLGSFMGGLAPGVSMMETPAGPRLQEAVIESSSSRNKIAVIALNGVIFGDSLDGGTFGLVDLIQAQLKRAAHDEQVKAVILKVDSPGGEVLASDDIYRAVLKFQKDTKKPVIASMGGVAASGGYYVCAPCQWIVANEMTITGSIGVIMSGFNYRGLMDKVGLRPEVFKSGKYKDMLRGSKKDSEITDEERKMIQDLIDETYQRFKTVVEEGRGFAAEKNMNRSDKGRQLAPDWADYADGRIFSGKEAHRRGYVDELGSFRTAVSRARQLAGISESSLVQYQAIFDLGHFLRLFGKSSARSVKVDVGLDLPRLKSGQPYFLAPSYLY